MKQLGFWEKLTLVIFVGMTVLRVYCAAHLGLGDDEAYYWDWSNRLQLSYYDHPGMTAWLIKIGTLLFGNTSIGVRVFALICNAASGFLLWRLGQRLFGRAAALIALLLYLFAPIFSLGGLLMVPDAPMGVAWIGLLLLFWNLLESEDKSLLHWTAAGLVLGLGLLSKYTLLVLALSTVAFLASEARLRPVLLSRRFWLAVVVAALCCLPIIIWNAQLGWPTLVYHLKDRQSGGGGANFIRWGQFWGSQAITLGPALLILCLWTWIVAVGRWSERRWRFIFLMTFPTFALFCAQALFAEFKPHWPAPAYSLVFIGVGQLFVEGFGMPRRKNAIRTVAAVLILAIFIPINLLFYVGSLTPIIPKLARIVAPRLHWETKFDPTNDLYGWDDLARHVKEIREQIKRDGGPSPFLSSSRYQLTSQLAFAMQERVWRVSPDKDQYLFWQSRSEWEPLLGKDSLYITDNRYERDPRNDFIFNSCAEDTPFLVYRGQELAREFHVWRCKGFTGIR